MAAFPPPYLKRSAPFLESLTSGEPQLFPHVSDELLQALATGPEHLQLYHELAPTSALTVPFRVRGRLIGLMHLFNTRARRGYLAEEISLAEELARHVAQAVERARLFDEAQRANQAKDRFLAVLSHELRNPLAPILAGVETSAAWRWSKSASSAPWRSSTTT